MELVHEANLTERGPYQPVVEDISMDDESLYDAVTQIENE